MSDPHAAGGKGTVGAAAWVAREEMRSAYRARTVTAVLALLAAFAIVSTGTTIALGVATGRTAGGPVRVLLVVGTGELAGFAFLGFLVMRAVERRAAAGLNLVSAGARRLADGDLAHRIEYGSGDEIGELADAFNRMAASMRFTVDGLRRSDERMRAILESAADGIVLLDPEDGRFIESNRRFAEIAGRKDEELRGAPVGDLASGLDTETVTAMTQRLRRGETVDGVRGVVRRPDGASVPVETTARLASAGGRSLLLLMIRDVSEREALEAEIQGGNEKLKHLFRVATKLRRTRDLDEQTQIIVDGVRESGWARAVLYLYGDGWTLVRIAYSGFTEEERRILESKAIPPSERRRLFEEVLPRFRVGNCFFVPGDIPQAVAMLPTILPSAIPASESLGWNPDDSLLIPIEGRDGRILASISLDDPVDRRRPQRDSLRILELFAAAAGATIEEDRIHSQLVRAERLKALGEMAGGVAHDFNNILGAILGRAQLLIARCKDPELRSSLDVIEKAARDGAQTVKRIQEFTRVRQEHAFAVTDAADIIRDTLEITRSSWRDQAEASGVHYEIHVESCAGLNILGNPSELREILTNLVLNALDAMPRGGQLVLSAARESGWVVLKISDTGHGMSEEVRSRVFDPYFTTKGVRGTGLGLSVSYGIACRHGGDIQVESRPGLGTTFTVSLPSASTEPPPASDGSLLQGDRGRILAVDDEENVRMVFGEILSLHGHAVVVAQDGEQGLELFDKEGPFDVVITDLGMPGISGWEFARRIRERDPVARIILSTGWGATLLPDDLIGTGISRVLAKPFEMMDLLAAIAEEMRSRPSRASA